MSKHNDESDSLISGHSTLAELVVVFYMYVRVTTRTLWYNMIISVMQVIEQLLLNTL